MKTIFPIHGSFGEAGTMFVPTNQPTNSKCTFYIKENRVYLFPFFGSGFSQSILGAA
jgi:hypothetical protein